jgi:hypothetical protein
MFRWRQLLCKTRFCSSNTVRLESRCALTKGDGSDYRDSLFRPEPELNIYTLTCIALQPLFNN